jgi:hypothetical protein
MTSSFTPPAPPVFLIVVDDTPEMMVALRFAAMRARVQQGRVAMLYTVEPREISPWAAIDATLDAEAANEAKLLLQKFESEIERLSGQKPITYIRRGERREALLQLLATEAGIFALILAADTGSKSGPGPLIGYLTSPRSLRELKIPLTIVPDTYDFNALGVIV